MPLTNPGMTLKSSEQSAQMSGKLANHKALLLPLDSLAILLCFDSLDDLLCELVLAFTFLSQIIVLALPLELLLGATPGIEQPLVAREGRWIDRLVVAVPDCVNR